jgi:hypothetical protein
MVDLLVLACGNQQLFMLKLSFYFSPKPLIMRRSIVLSFPLPKGFPDKTISKTGYCAYLAFL